MKLVFKVSGKVRDGFALVEISYLSGTLVQLENDSKHHFKYFIANFSIAGGTCIWEADY